MKTKILLIGAFLVGSMSLVGCQKNNDADPQSPPDEESTSPHSMQNDRVAPDTDLDQENLGEQNQDAVSMPTDNSQAVSEPRTTS